MSEHGKRKPEAVAPEAAPQEAGAATPWRAHAGSIMARYAAALTSASSVEPGETGGLDRKRVLALLEEIRPLIAGSQGGQTGMSAPLIDARDIGRAVAELRPTIVEEVSRSFYRDSGRSLSAEELAMLHRAIDEAAAERYADWASRRMVRYQADAEAHARYMSFLSHDLRGSLNGVVLMLEVMRREMTAGKESAEKIADLDLLRRSLLDTVALIERHVLADRIRRGQVTPSMREMTQTGMSALLENLRARSAAEAAERKVVVEVNASGAQTVRTDNELLETLLGELITNAIRHSRKADKPEADKSVRPTVRVLAEMGAKEWSVSVADEGTDENACPTIARFLDPVERMKIKDRGLGLTLAQDLGRLLAGHVSVSRDEQQRTIVRLSVPVSL